MNPLLRIFEPILGENKAQNALFSKFWFFFFHIFFYLVISIL